MLSAHRVKSQGRPRTTSSAQLIGQIGLPARVSLQHPMSRKHHAPKGGQTAVSCPDNAFAYVKNRSLRELLAARGIRHLTTEPYRPRTNGKVCVSRWWCRPVGRRGAHSRRSDSGKRHVEDALCDRCFR